LFVCLGVGIGAQAYAQGFSLLASESVER
jgi:hypothetical protein